MGFIDKVLTEFAPAYQLQRIQNKAAIQAYNNAYDGANKNTGTRKSSAHGKSIMGSEERNLNKYDRETLVLEGYNALRNNPIIVSAVNRLQDFVVENGIKVQAKTSSDKFNEQAEQYFNQWTKVCDYRQRLNLGDFQKQIVSALHIEGELYFVLMANGTITPIEANRIQTPRDLISNPLIVQGIKLSKGGIPLGIYICDRQENGYLDLNSYQFVPIENVIPITNIIRPDQIRGVPLLAPILNCVKDLDEINTNTRFRSRIDSMQSLIVTSNKNINQQASSTNRQAKKDTPEEEAYFEKTDIGTAWHLEPGADVKSFQSNNPNQIFPEYQRLILREIGGCLGIPFEILTLDFSSGIGNSRSALTMASKTIKRFQSVITDKFLQRLWNWKIAQGIKSGEIMEAPKDVLGVSEWHKVNFIVPGLDWIDPANESASDTLAYKLNVKSLSDICKKRGVEFEDVMATKIYEYQYTDKLLKESGLDITLPEIMQGMNDPGQFNNNQIDRGNDSNKGNK